MIRLKNISLTLHGKKILDNISATINPQDFIIVVGHNGAGKSVLFDVIAGKRKPDSGKILYNTIDVTHTPERERALLIERLFQNPRFNCVPSMTVAQNISISHYKGQRATLAKGAQDIPDSVVQQLKKAQLYSQEILATAMKNLSGGQQQRIAFIMATMRTPELLLLDEPTAALDPDAATSLLSFVHSHIKHHTITALMITHDAQIARILGNKIWVIEKGTLRKEIIKDGSSIDYSQIIKDVDYENICKE